MSSLKICLAGATGNVGSRLARAILDAEDLSLSAAVGRRHGGQPLAEILGDARTELTVRGTLGEALDAPSDVVVDYTKPNAVKGHVLAAIDAGRAVVIGTSGLSDSDYAEIAERADEVGVGVFAAGNFSLTAALLLHFATVAARHVPHWEILDYAPDTKPDAPSGTARELASTLGTVGKPRSAVPVAETLGERAARGATLGGAQVHSVRVPGYYNSAEAVFGLAGERLTLRHDSMSYDPYVSGTLLAARKVGELRGLHRGMTRLLGLD